MNYLNTEGLRPVTFMDNQNKPLITVVTVCYNAVNELEKTMLSVLNQTYDNIEYIVIDGGSKDGTVDIIKKYADRLAYWVSEPDKGIYDAMNKGIKAATGEWINFMNAGDWFYEIHTLSIVFDKAIDAKYDVVYGDRISSYSKADYVQKPWAIEEFSFHFPIFHQSSFIRTGIMKKTGYDLNYRICADFAFFYKVWSNNGAFFYVNVIMSVCECENGLSTHPRNDVRRVKEDIMITKGYLNMFTRFLLYKVFIFSWIKCYMHSLFPALFEKWKYSKLGRNVRFKRIKL